MLQIKMLICRQHSCTCMLTDQAESRRANSGQRWIVQVRGAMITVSVYYKPSVEYGHYYISIQFTWSH